MNISILLSFPKSLFFNFCVFPFRVAVKIPIWIHYRSHINIHRGGVVLPEKINFAMIRIGFHREKHIDHSLSTIFYLEKNAQVLFRGEAHIGYGSKILVFNDAKLFIGDNFRVSSASTIRVSKKIEIGNNVLCSWNVMMMDFDGHNIYIGDKQINKAAEIIIEDKVWIGSDVTILKGASIPTNTIIGTHSVVGKMKIVPNTIIAGIPARQVKVFDKWCY